MTKPNSTSGFDFMELTPPQAQLVSKWRRLGASDLRVDVLPGTGTAVVTLNFPRLKVTVDRNGNTDQGVPY